MADKIAANLVLNTSLRAPRGRGLTRVKTELQEIKQLMADINATDININIRLHGTQQAMTALNQISLAAQNQLNRQQAAQAARANRAAQRAGGGGGGGVSSGNNPANRGGSAGGGGGGTGSGGGGNLPPNTAPLSSAPPGLRTQNRITRNLQDDTLDIVQESGSRQGVIGIKTERRDVTNPETGQLEGFTEKRYETNDANRLALQRGRTEALEGQRRTYKATDQQDELRRREMRADALSRYFSNEGYQEERRVGKTTFDAQGNPLENEERLFTKALADGRQERRRYSTATNELSAATIEETAASKANAKATAKAAKTQQDIANVNTNRRLGERAAQGFARDGFIEQPRAITNAPADPSRPTGPRKRSDVREFRRNTGVGQDEITEIRKFNEATGELTTTYKRTAEAIRISNDEMRNSRRLLEFNANQSRAAAQEQALLNQGYTRTAAVQKEVSIGNQRMTATVSEFQRVSGNALTGNLAVEVAKVDSATGNMTNTALNGAQAVRKLGDSFTSAVAKVGLWFAATSAIFIFARAAQSAAQQIQELETNTVFLARVGQKLGSSFAERYEQAKLLTTGIVELSAVTGVSATEAQKAASIFLRAGQNRVEALESTKAAMLAASIAELEVEEAAKLLSAAQKQFNLDSRDLIPTLDTLNSLSNRYVVSTNDLLQAISRGGKIYAEAGGKIETYAATIAIVSDKTRRSGAEVGNALKTIQARLTSAEVSKVLTDKLGLSLYDASGGAKEFNKVLLELQAAMVGLNNEQRDQLGVTIAGARQYNILKNALDSVVDIAIAEATALRDSGSATSEAIERSQTLSAAIGRLQGEFSVLINSGGGAIGGLATSIINLINLILKLVTAFDGFAIKVAVLAVAMIALRAVIDRTSVAFLTGASTGLRYAAALLAAGNAGRAAAVSLQLMTQSVRALMIAFLPTAVIGAGLIILLGFVNLLTNAMNASALAGQQMAENAENTANAAERERKAVMALTTALEQQIVTQRRINKLTAEGKPVQESDKKRTKENIENLAKSLNIKAPTDLTNKDQLLEFENERIRKVNEATADLKKAYEGQIAAEEGSLSELQKIRTEKYGTKTVQQQRDKVKQLEDSNSDPTIIIQAKYQLQQMIELEGKIADARNKLKEVQGKLYEVNETKPATPYTTEQFDAKERGEAILEEIKAKEKRDKYENIAGPKGTQQLQQEFDTLIDQQRELVDITKQFTPGTENYERWAKEVNIVTEGLEKLNAELVASQIAIRRTQLERVFTPANEINASFLASRSKLDFAKNPKAFGGERFEGLNANNADTAAQRTIAAQAAKNIQEVLNNPDAGNADKLAYVEQQREVISKALAAARQGEVAAAQELLNIELQVTKERVNQNKEAAKAAGLLSDEDKVKLLSQAEYFKNNPNKEISATDAFFASADGNRLGQQFFGSKFNFDQEDIVNKQFRGMFGADFGVSRDVTQAEKELQKYGLGPNATDAEREKVMQDIKKRIGQDASNQATLLGEPTFGPDWEKDLGASNPMTGQLSGLTVDVGQVMSSVDFEPLIAAFDSAVNTQIIGVRNELIDMIRATWKPLQEAGLDRQSGLPPVSGQ